MRILFDFELFNDPSVDMHLLDIMLGMKEECCHLLSPYLNEIEEGAGMVLICIRPHAIALSYHSCSNAELDKKIRRILATIDWRHLVKRCLKCVEN